MKTISYSDKVQAWEYHEFGIIMQILLCIVLALIIGLFFVTGLLPNLEKAISATDDGFLIANGIWAWLATLCVIGYFIGKASGRRYFLRREKLLTH